MTQQAPSVYPALRYKDAPAAIEWLGKAFGFEPNMVVPGPDDTIAHAQLVRGDAVIMLSSERMGDPFGERAGLGWLYVVIDDPDGLYARATDAGAQTVMELVDTEYGSRDFSVRDPENNIWSFGTYRPTLEPAAGAVAQEKQSG